MAFVSQEGKARPKARDVEHQALINEIERLRGFMQVFVDCRAGDDAAVLARRIRYMAKRALMGDEP